MQVCNICAEKFKHLKQDHSTSGPEL